MSLKAWPAALLLAAALPGLAAAQFGQNHVVIRDFDWRMRSTEHFDVYYYKETEALLEPVSRILEDSFARLTKRLDIQTEPPVWLPESAKKRLRWRRRPFFIYASPNEFQQNNIAHVGDGTGGITEPFKDRFMVYNDGSRQWLEEVIEHELTHIMQFHILVSGWWKSGRILKTIVYPLWMMEGMAGFETHGVESTLEEVTIRDAATSGTLLPLTRLEHFGHLKPHQITLAYKQGAAAMAFLADQYGPRKPGDMLRLFENRLETSQVLRELVGLDAFEFDKKFREYIEQHYRAVARRERLREPDSFGAALTRTPDNIPQFNAAPVFTPDGAYMYYLTTGHGHPAQVREMNMRTGRSRKVTPAPWARVENIALGNFANLSRALDLSKDGRYLLFSGTRNHEDAFYMYDRIKRKLMRKPVPGFELINQPHFSPDGTLIVFSGMRQSQTDLYLYRMSDGRVDPLTNDARDDAMPVFTPDGKAVVFSAETLDVLDPHGSERRLYRIDLADRRQTLIEESGGEARDPLVSEDGARVIFTRDGEGSSEICEVDLQTGKTHRLTRTYGGSFTATYVGDEIAFASLRRGNVHLYKGPRADFLNEEMPNVPRRAPGDMAFTLPGMGGVRPSSSTVALTAERPYRFNYSTDLFIPAFFYSSAGGFFWTSYWQGSDLLGNHTNTALVNLHNPRSFDYQLSYTYDRWRPQFLASLQGSAREDLIDFENDHRVDDAYHAQTVGVAFPFDRYHRVETLLTSVSERVTDRTDGRDSEAREARFATAALVRDTVRGRYLVATQGERVRASYSQAVEALGGGRVYRTATLEAHKFFQTSSQSAIALRALGGQTIGRDHPQFILGGLGGLRGYGRSTTDDIGRSLALVNAEWRFPIVPDLNYYMWYFFPDFYFKAIYGAVFTDTGYAWDSHRQLRDAQARDLRNSYGIGVRLFTFILQEYPLVIAMDYARRTTSDGGIFYVYLGQLF